MCISNLALVHQPAPNIVNPAREWESPEYWPSEGQTSHGLFEYLGSLYCFFCSGGPNTQYSFQVRKSTDGGLSWSLLTGVPDTGSGSVNLSRKRTTFQRHLNKVYFAYVENVVAVGLFLRVGIFNLETESFTAQYSSQGPAVASVGSFPNTTPVEEFNITQCISGDSLIISYCNTQDTSVSSGGRVYWHPKFAFAVFSLTGLTWTTADTVSQTADHVYSVYKLVPSGSLIHCVYYEYEYVKAVPIEAFNQRLRHIALNLDLTLAGSASTITEDLFNTWFYDASPVITYNDGVAKLAIAVYSNTLYTPAGYFAQTNTIELYVGSDSSSPSFALESILNVEELGAVTNTVFGGMLLNVYGLQSVGLAYIDNKLTLFVTAHDNGATFPANLQLYKSVWDGSAWESCLLYRDDDRTDIYLSYAGQLTYAAHNYEVTDTSVGKLLTFGIFVQNNLSLFFGYFYSGLLSTTVNLSVLVDDRLSFADGLPRVRLSTPGQGIVVHTCPDVIVNSEFCSFVKTASDSETPVTNCEETVHTENTDPCEEVE